MRGARPVRPDRWQTLRRLFADAVAQPPAVRSAFLADRCGLDLVLRREVEALLAADRQARDDRFLRDPVHRAVRQMMAMKESGPKRRFSI